MKKFPDEVFNILEVIAEDTPTKAPEVENKKNQSPLLTATIFHYQKKFDKQKSQNFEDLENVLFSEFQQKLNGYIELKKKNAVDEKNIAEESAEIEKLVAVIESALGIKSVLDFLELKQNESFLLQILEHSDQETREKLIDLAFENPEFSGFESDILNKYIIKTNSKHAAKFASSLLEDFHNSQKILPSKIKERLRLAKKETIPAQSLEEILEEKYSTDPDAKPKQTYFSFFAGNSFDFFGSLEAKLDSGQFSDIATIEFINLNHAAIFFELARKHEGALNSLKHVRLTWSEKGLYEDSTDEQLNQKIPLEKTLNELGISFEYSDPKEYLNVGLHVEKARKEPPAEENKIQDSNYDDNNKISIAGGLRSKNYDINNSADTTFTMFEAGEVLNDRSIAEPQIRYSIKKDDVRNTLVTEIYKSSNFSEVTNLESLDDTKLEGFRKTSDGKIYYLFKRQLRAGQKTRLLSADAAEEFVGIKGATDGILIEKGDDDFFYATANEDRVLSYVVKADHPKHHKKDYDAIPTSHKAREIIDPYKNPNLGYEDQATKEKLDINYLQNVETHKESMNRIFDQRLGACGQRVLAVLFKLRQVGFESNLARAVGINNDHVALEINYNGKWIAVDFGGAAAREIQANSSDQFYKLEEPPIEEQPKTRTLENLLEEIPEDVAQFKRSEEQTNQQEVIIQNEEEQATENLEATNLAEIQKLKAESLSTMAKSLLSVLELPKINEENGLKANTTESDKKKILVVTKSISEHANFFLSEATTANRQTFYIDSPSKIDLHRTNLLIANDNNPTLSQEGLLSNFLNSAKTNSEQKPLLLINWSAFNTKERLRLNTLLDIERKINGEKIDDSIQIIGLANEASQDPSFLSRHDERIESQITFAKPKTTNAETVKIIDLQGFPDWRRQLFGKVILVGDQMQWQKSEFVKTLEEQSNFQITNLSPKAAEELQKEFKQAQATKKFIYNGREIEVPENVQIDCGTVSFDFTKFGDENKINVARDVTFNLALQDCNLINTHLFDSLLCGKTINDLGEYIEEKGLIENCAESENKRLKLFVSSELSDSQWYCLFHQAQEKNVALELYLAQQVKLPNNVKFAESHEDGTEQKDAGEDLRNNRKRPQIYVSNNPNFTAQNLANEKYAIIDVEDFSYQDLVERVEFETTETGFRNFKKISSQLIEKLKDNEKIILKGEFSPDLLQMFEPILTGLDPQFADIGENLTIIIEDKKISLDKVYEPLNWLPKESVNIKKYDDEAIHSTDLVFVETEDKSFDLTDSNTKSEAFIKARKDHFSGTLNDHSMLRLVGDSGVGKSRLLKEFENDSESNSEIFRELKSFENWAQPCEKGKRKILFIDESNIENLHFTIFSPLKNKGTQRVFYQGKFYDLGENHKVVFACNPVEFGGGRSVQKLFDDGQIPAIHLRDFPASYIYEKILKESIYDKLNDDIKGIFSEEKFKEICQKLIKEHKGIKDETVRELQERLLIKLDDELEKDSAKVSIESKNFISTEATAEIEKSLITAINIRQKQREELFPNEAVGLNGILLEGDSGTGKSELIGAILASKEIAETKLDEERSDDKQKFYKIDAALPLEQKKQIIVKAFENGDIVWIDEINSCIDDGLEKILNAALTGDHPEGKKDAPKPGFMLISSFNSAGLEGRSIISPALRHRTILPKVKSLKEYSDQDLTKIINHWLSQKTAESELFVKKNIREKLSQNIAKDFCNLLKIEGAENFNLRMLRSSLKEILPSQIELVEKTNETEILEPLSPREVILDFTPSTIIDISNENDDAIRKLKDLGTRAGKLNQKDNLKLFHPKNETTDKFDFSSTRDNLGFQNVLDILRNTITEKKINDPELAAKICLIVIKNGGTKNKEALKQDLEKLGLKESDLTLVTSFSGKFQKLSDDSKIFTGNKNAKNFVAMRLKRITPEHVLAILEQSGVENAEEKFKEMRKKIGLTNQSVLENLEIERSISR